jgi:translocation and assembly module TamB
MEVVGKRFEFSSGTLTFSGSITPQVEFVATTATSSATITLNVSGPASDPVIKFSSSPDLPQEEVLSQLLLDRSVGSLSPVQAAQLVDAAAQLTGALERGNGIFDRIRKTTGLDDLDIRQNKTGGTTVGVGRRLGDRTRLGVEQDTSTGQGRVSVDIDINKNLKARGETGQDGSGKVGLTYEKEY